jgi:hypothetical protein
MAIRKPIDRAGAGRQLFHMYRSYQGQMVFVLDVRVAKEPNRKQPPPLPKEAKHFLAGEDQKGCLQFAPTAATAPIIHVDGPLTMALLPRNQLIRNNLDNEPRVAVARAA